jgi:hypothetical protein
MTLPVESWQEGHVEACQVCREKRHASAVAIHEATHLAVALALGLTVEFCSIDDGREVAMSELESSLYGHIYPAGSMIPAQVTRLADDSLERHPTGTLVAMVAPSCVVTSDPDIDAYGALEAQMGVHMAKVMGIDPIEILDSAKAEVTDLEGRILRYAERLAQKGRIDL